MDVTNPEPSSDGANQDREQDQNPKDTPRNIWLKIIDGLFYVAIIATIICIFRWSRG